MAELKSIAKLPEAVAVKYELKGFSEAGIITFPGGIGEVDLSIVSLETAEKINKIRPGILVLKTKSEKPETSKG
jgi:hypothetical protein